MSENIQARIGMGIPASVSPVLADMEIRELKQQLADAMTENERLLTQLAAVVADRNAYREHWEELVETRKQLDAAVAQMACNDLLEQQLRDAEANAESWRHLYNMEVERREPTKGTE